MTRPLGADGPQVSLLGLGCNNFGQRVGLAETRDIVDAALAEGITFFDTADLYGRTDSERYLGQALGSRRADVVVATKWGYTRMEGAPRERGLLGRKPVRTGSASYIRWALDRSLQRLGSDWVDVYQYHAIDPDTPLEETFEALLDVLRTGKIRYVGLPTMEPAQLDDAVSLAKRLGLPLVSMQVHVNMIRREPAADLLPACARHGVGVLPYLPLEGGLLTGKYHRDEPLPQDSRYASMPVHWPRERWLTEESFARVEALERFAAAGGLTMLQVAFGGLAAMSAVSSIIAGATRPEQVRANAAACRWTPSADELARLRAL
ncbi:MAG TPA: aldo/keto reductase [Gaiellaceae bacterium]|nr:aldo/keto reductase [Gaiellaceae bacterium]